MDVGVGGGDGHRCNSSVGDATLGQRHGATALVGRAAIGGGWCDDVCGGDILGFLSLSAVDVGVRWQCLMFLATGLLPFLCSLFQLAAFSRMPWKEDGAMINLSK